MSLITAGADTNHQDQVEMYCTCMELLLLTIIPPTQCICILYVILSYKVY